MKRSTGALLVAASLFVGCSGAKGAVGLLGEIQEVQQAVAAASATDSVHVNLANERFLSIGVINSSINGQPDEVRATRALELAKVAYASFPSRNKLQRVSVAFVKQTRRFLILTVSDGRDA